MASWSFFCQGPTPRHVQERPLEVFATKVMPAFAWLAGYAQAGVAHFVLRSADLGRDLEPLASEVIPRLRAADGSRRA